MVLTERTNFLLMIQFSAVINRFKNHGEKTGWTYIDIPASTAELLNPATRKSFRVKGTIDGKPFQQSALIPMGCGNFIFVINAPLRKALARPAGSKVTIKMELDKSELIFDADFMNCLNEDPLALEFFNTLPIGHRRYFNTWISGAKTEHTKVDRIANSLNALAHGQNYGEMMRSLKKNNR